MRRYLAGQTITNLIPTEFEPGSLRSWVFPSAGKETVAVPELICLELNLVTVQYPNGKKWFAEKIIPVGNACGDNRANRFDLEMGEVSELVRQ